ncbi:MAG TPA: bifunctional DNA-formamidopyrimidine glycosylase/DNA-(apurinic or apyrimidinic site) lyase [Candidatus Limnocylindria bacterium]|jgi:formamidopyrimidine-DNA glycosylase|nr:bifunctional DNA-formamidopyrimidine glycosylase/DNA-(apurinic or apyrimidinic site) lyase [Candidatus Limnocylindria bacterium]
MPELPEVEVLVRHLDPLLRGRTVRGVSVGRPKVVLPSSAAGLSERLVGATFQATTRRAKCLLFELRHGRKADPFTLIGHLGMTGRMFLQPKEAPLPKHTAVSLDLGGERFVFEDTRYFGRFHLDSGVLAPLGPEPLSEDFTVEAFAAALKRSSQPIKVKLLDQTLVAGIGNIYASEALFRAGISPKRAANRVKADQVRRLRETVREVLAEAIACGSTIPLDFAGGKDGLFYYGTATDGGGNFYDERLRVYDREGQPCGSCGTPIRQCVQAARSTYWCPQCQRG